MEKKSVVKNVQGNGTFDWNGKTFYVFAIEFENGDSGDFNTISDTQNKFVKGQETAYTIDAKNPQYPKIKPVWAGNSNNNQNQSIPAPINQEKDLLIVKQVCVKCAAEMVGKNDPTAVIKTANVLVQWIMSGEKPTKETTDLPF